MLVHVEIGQIWKYKNTLYKIISWNENYQYWQMLAQVNGRFERKCTEIQLSFDRGLYSLHYAIPKKTRLELILQYFEESSK